MLRYGALIVLALGLGLMTPEIASAKGPEVSPEEYQLFMDWKDGREDPRLEKFSDAVKLKKIAKNLGVKKSTLEAAIAKVEPLAATLASETEKAIQESLKQTSLKGRVAEVEVGAEQAHVVAGVKWRCGDMRDFDKEAAYVAWAVGDSAPVVKTLALWCVNGSDTKLFSAKIGRSGFARISKSGIERFASSRYIKLFEAVRRGAHR